MSFITKNKKSGASVQKRWIYAELIFIFLAAAFYFLCGDKLQYKEISYTQSEISGSVPEFVEGSHIQQFVASNFDELTSISFLFADYGRKMNGTLDLVLKNETNSVVYPTISIDVSTIHEGEWYTVTPPFSMNGLRGKVLSIELWGHSVSGEAPTIFYAEDASGIFYSDGQEISGQLCIDVKGKDFYIFGHYYGYFLLIGIIILTIVFIHMEYCREHNKKNFFLTLGFIWDRYHFLIEQLVLRDFRTKYKRSVLGYVWSFLNPLLTSLVQYMVFSALFDSDIENFPIYLLTGTLFFNFFSEAVSQGLSSIVSNAALINKVYVPKWIYPVTKVCASATNFIISLFPLLVVSLFTGCKLSPALLLLVFEIVCLLFFCIGLSMVLTSCNVFFRDTQYLWGIATMVWMYSTPLFYPETILPPALRNFLQFNPLYHYIKFARVCIIDGVSPELSTYAFCLGAACISLLIGCVVFKKSQNKFALYI